MEQPWWEVCLAVRDLDRTRRFYERLGFLPVGGEPAEGWLVLAHQNLRLALFQGHIGETTLNLRGADVFALSRALEARGLTLASGPEVEADGSAGATLRDPEGRLVYLNTSPGETAPGADGRPDPERGT
jgi:catechol 2,3-dioxygenase-like lactoylglutathione lyase family enzyme